MERDKIKEIKLLATRKERYNKQLFVCEGTKLVSDLINTSLTIEQIYFTDKAKECDFLRNINIPTIHISENDMKRISHLKTPTPILALVKMKSQKATNVEDNELIIALDSVQDPGNMGTIIRIADWFGIGKIVCSEDTVDIYNPKVVQATMGAIARVEVEYTNLYARLKEYSLRDTPIYITALDGEDIYTQSITQEGVIVMGNEGQGVSDKIASLSTSKLFIPSYGKSCGSESLNVSIATAVVCAEFRRRISKL